MTTDSRSIKLGRIARHLVAVSRELPDPFKAAFFLRNACRLIRIVHKQNPFQPKEQPDDSREWLENLEELNFWHGE